MPTYADAKQSQISSAVAQRVYGVSLDGSRSLDGYQSILFCGLSGDGEEIREVSTRIWHLPENKIIRSGTVTDFVHDGQPVRWFEVYKDIVPIEEKYVGVSIGSELKRSVTARTSAEVSGARVFAAYVGEPTRDFVHFFDIPTSVALTSQTRNGDWRHTWGCQIIRDLGGQCQPTLNEYGSPDTQFILP